MMTIENLQEIEKYLKSKNLSAAVFIEVYDHFVIQISSVMKDERSFSEAFIQTKINWQNELEMVKADVFSFKRIAKIEKSILQRRFRKRMVIAFVVSVFVGTVFYLDEFIYLFVQGGMITAHLMLMLYQFAFNKMSFKDHQKMTFHPLLLKCFTFILIPLPLLNILFSTTEDLWSFPLNHMAITFSVMLQIQLLYLRTRKVNILLTS